MPRRLLSVVVRPRRAHRWRESFVFVGPYAEWVRPAADHLTAGGGEEGEAEWGRLLDGGVLAWNIGSDSGFLFRHEGRRLRRYCCVPGRERPGCPRWPMLFHFGYTATWNPEDEQVDVGYGEVATDWADIDRRRELDWFRRAFAPELGSCARLVGAEPTFRWGLVHWVIP